MTQVAIITDLHWGVRNSNQFFLDRQLEFYYNFFFPYLKDHGINDVWILGDVFENRKQINIQTLNHTKQFFEFLNAEFKTVCIAGNHDFFYKNTNSVGSLDPILSQLKNIHYIPVRDVVTIDSVNIGFISWISPDIRDESIRWIQTVDASILCGHFEINSFEIVKGVLCHSGFDQSMFERFDAVFSGHFHIRSKSGVISYLGNPYQTNWSEASYEKGFHLFDIPSRQLTFIPNPVSVFDVVRYTDDFDIVNFDPTRYHNKIVRIYADQCDNKKKFELMIERMSKNCHSVEVVEDKEVLVDSDGKEPPSDTAQLIRQFLDSCKIDHLDRKILDTMVFAIYQEAIEKGVQC
jgi:DNA repair exonuclease SbcCD nuclease subunit